MHPGGGDRNEKDSDRSSQRQQPSALRQLERSSQRERLVGLVAAGCVSWRCRRQCTGATAVDAYYPYGYYPYGQSPYYGPRCGPVWNGYNWVPAC